MARPLRINFENAVYHILSRGNRKEKIFYSMEDKLVFQKKMNKTFQKYSFICYAYCLNHKYQDIVNSFNDTKVSIERELLTRKNINTS